MSEDIEAEFYAYQTLENPNTESYEDDDWDIDALLKEMDSDDDWETVIDSRE